MKKVFLHGAFFILLFFGTWFALQQIDWITLFKVKSVSHTTEQKVGDLLWELFKRGGREIDDVRVTAVIDSIVARICTANQLPRQSFEVHILDDDEVNAFALPNRRIIVFSGLIARADNPEELAGVICHEIAHIQLNHVMKKLVKEIGLSVLVSIASGSGSIEIIKEAGRLLSSSAFDRELEREADIMAVDYLIGANITPEPYANFLYRLSSDDNGPSKYLTWISTHPNAKDRAEYIIEYSRDRFSERLPILPNETWQIAKESLVY